MQLINLFVERVWNPVVEWLSLEVLLRHHSNGGAMILLRALWTASWIYAAVLLLINGLVACEAGSQAPTCRPFPAQIAATVHWFGTMLAAAYASLYTRYSAQWSYLANVYNRIKETQARMNSDEAAKRAIAEWKAGFIEDAEDLHLATKPTFASIISAWRKDPDVQRAFCDHTLGREERWADLIDRVEKTCAWRDMKLSAQAEARRKRKSA